MPDERRRRSRPASGLQWVATPTGVWIPVRSLASEPARAPRYGDLIREYWKICLSSREIFGEEPDRRVTEVFRTGSLRFVLGLLSWAAFNLSDASYHEMQGVQRELARLFLPQEALQRIDQWRRGHPAEPELYFLGAQQLLAAMTTAVLYTKRGQRARPEGPPFSSIGRALAHLAGLVDPLQVDRPDFQSLSNDATRRLFIEFLLRNGLFYDHEDYRYLIARYYEMFCRVAPALTADPHFVDIPALFRKRTGLTLKTYLRFGVAFLTSVHAVAAKRNGPALLNLKQLRPKRHLRGAWRRFTGEVITTPRRFRRLHRAQLRLSTVTEYNFLAAERYPVVALSKDAGCCLSITFLERKFGSAMMHRLMEESTATESAHFREFFGRVFERYVQDICRRMLGNIFVSGITYGRNEEGGDGWVLYPPEAILIEAKSGFLLLETILSGRFEGFEKRFRETLLNGARQLTRVIDDFRSRRFTVGGLGPDTLRVIYPVIINLRHLPMEKFLWDYVRNEMQATGYLTQSAVRGLTIMAVKDLENIEALGSGLLDLIRARLDDPGWRDTVFSNFLFQRFAGEGPPPNEYLVERYRELLGGAMRQIFNVSPRAG